MSEINQNPEISWKYFGDIPCIHFAFKGKLTKAEALNAIEKWKQYSAFRNNKNILIWDCKGMKDYDSSARHVWQNAMNELKGEIEEIWIIADSLVFKATAKVMSLFTSIEIKIVSSEEKIQIMPAVKN
jgi:ABC-type transporter Mla MlaB component